MDGTAILKEYSDKFCKKDTCPNNYTYQKVKFLY